MAEREENKNLKASDKATPTTNVEDDESSASEYEEIIEEVTDYSESDGETEVKKTASKTQVTNEKLTKVATKDEEEDKEVIKKSSSVKSNDSLKTDISTTSFVSVEEIIEPIEKIKETTKVSTENVETISQTDSAQNLTAESSVSIDVKTVVDTTKTEHGEFHQEPLQQSNLQQNMSQNKTIKQHKNNSSINKNLNKDTNTNQNININKLSTNKTITASNVTNCSSESNMLTVNNNTNTIAKTLNNKEHNFKDTQQLQQQQQQQPQTHQQKPQQTTNETTATVVSNSSINTNLVSSTSCSSNQVNRLGVPQKEDSGTESGEDLRLIAAGLRDKLHMQTDTDLIEEVTAALSRLESSLKEGKDIPVDSNKRNALLALVARLQTGLTSPEKLAAAAMAVTEMDGANVNYEETSSPEADAHRSNRQRFAKRRNRNSRHTVGVSREELADARRYIEDMQIMDNISNCTTPESNLATVTPPQWFPIEKNSSAGTISSQQPPLSLYRPNQFVPNNIKNSTECLSLNKNATEARKNVTGARRPLSGDYSVSFQQLDSNTITQNAAPVHSQNTANVRDNENVSPNSALKSTRFINKKQFYKRANTIDIPKTKKYNADFDTDSEMEDKGPALGLKRTVQVSVKQKVRSVVPPFEPKTENDHKFLAFINKQSPKPGLGWNNSRSVTNWTNKFGNIKHTFEVGAAATTTTGKPPQVPGHVPQNAAKNYWNKQATQSTDKTHTHHTQMNYQTQRNQQDVIDQQRRLERERLERERIERERERIERDRLERQKLERERKERDRLEREYYEKERLERERLAAEQHAAMPSMMVPKPAPVNQFIHAPQSVFRPIDNNDNQNIIRPIPKMPNNGHIWQPPTAAHKGSLNSLHTQAVTSPQLSTAKNYANTPYASSAPSTPSPSGLPWASKPTVDNSIFKSRANKFEEQSLRDERNNTYLQRHNSLRTAKNNQPQVDEYKKRPSLPNTTDPYLALHSQYMPNQAYHTSNNYPVPPPPTNISFTYADLKSKSNYQSYPCLPSAVNMCIENNRSREDSLTNPEAIPLVLTSANPSYSPQTDTLQPYSNVPTKPYDYISPIDSVHTSPNMLTIPPTDYTDDDLDSDNMMEYRVETKVMRKPQSQTAVTVGRRQAHVSDDEVFGKNSRAARNLLSTMKNIGNSNHSKINQKENIKKPEAPSSPKVCLSPDGRSYQAPIVEPLFPEVTNFEPNRTPLYLNGSDTRQTNQPNKHSTTYAYPQPTAQPTQPPQMKPTTIPQYEKEYENNSTIYNSSQSKQYQQQNYHSSVQNSYVNETQPAYIVTYPTDDISDFEDNSYANKQHTTGLQRRSRNISENSTTSSSMSYSMPSSRINWTANPIHNDDAPKTYAHTENSINTNTHYTQSNQQYDIKKDAVKSAELTTEKPHIAPKPQIPTMNTNMQYMQNQQYVPHSTPQQQQPPQQEILQRTQTTTQHPVAPSTQYSPQQQISTPQAQFSPKIQLQTQQMPTQNQYSPQHELPAQTQYTSQQQLSSQATQQQHLATAKPTVPQQQFSTQQKSAQQTSHLPNVSPQKPANQQYTKLQQQQTQEQQHTVAYQPAVTAQQQPKLSIYQPQTQQQYQQTAPQQKSQVHTTETMSRTQTTTKQTFEKKKPQAPLLRQSTYTAGITPLQAQNRVLSQQSLVTKQQQVQQQQQVIELRRKSLGNVLDVQQEQRKSAYFENQQQIKQEYKSSAPADTPDIVKSSLPKDENMPILKKFGPPQRHHYVPNAYQNPSGSNTTSSVTSTHTKKYECNGNIVKTTQKEVVQHSTYTNKPAIVEIPATPQPSEDQIPRNIVFNNVSAFTSMCRRSEEDRAMEYQPQTRPNRLSKCDSWNQIVQMQNQQVTSPTSPKFNNSGHELRRTRSGHSLAVPKMFEAGIDKAEISEKQKTVAAYFGGKKSPSELTSEEHEVTIRKSAINRTKTSEKVSASRKSLNSATASSIVIGGGLSRSATMPHIANLNLLDESNVEDAFEQLIMGS